MSTVLRQNPDDQRVPEMEHLRFNLGWTLQAIADKFGISRERVRQKLGNTGQVHHKVTFEKRTEIAKKNQKLSSQKLAKLLGIQPGNLSQFRDTSVRHEIEGGWAAIGTEMENYASRVLNHHGIKHQLMGHHHVFDILLDNGLRIDVKSSDPIKGITKIASTYSFRTSQETRGNYADFFLCITRDTKEIFIIPASETRGNSTPIRFSWPNPRSGIKSKFHQYHNRFDLLKGKS